MEIQRPWYMYMLLCDQKMFYVGISNNIIQRLKKHKEKKSLFTKKFSDLMFVYAEKCKNKYDAARREQQLKGWSHVKKQTLLDGKLGINSCTEFVEELMRDEKFTLNE